MISDLRFAYRQLVKTRAMTLVIMLSLALGIGATATVTCWIKRFVHEPLHGVPEQESLVVLKSSQGGGNVSLPDIADFSKLESIFSGITTYQMSPVSLAIAEETTWANAQIVSANFFGVMGVRPLLGRTFLPDEDQKPRGNPVVVISERLWRARLAADPGIIGRQIELNRHAFTVIGVVPAAFLGSMQHASFDFWAPLSMAWEIRNQLPMVDRYARGWHNLARLRPGVTALQAQTAVDAMNADLAHAMPESNREIHHRVLTFPQQAENLKQMFLTLLAVAAGVLLIVISNVANLLLGRAISRQKEIAIRVAAGASRLHLVRQLLVESVLLALPGGVLGLVLASWAVDSVGWFIPAPLAARVHLEFHLDASTVALSVLLSTMAGILFGLAPALQASRVDLSSTLKAGGRSSGASAHSRLRGMLVTAEVAVAVVLLVGAGLLIKGYRSAQRMDIGFKPEGVLIAGMQIGMNGYDAKTGLSFYRAVREKLEALPGVEAAALASWFPLGTAGCKGSGIRVEGYSRPAGQDSTYEYAIVSTRYFAALGIPLISGREFTLADNETAPKVAVVNEHFANRFWPGREAVGQRFKAFGEWRTVVGVARAGKYNRLDEPSWCFYYLPDQQGVPELDLSLCVRGQGDPIALAASVRRAVHEIDPRVELLNTFRLTDHVASIYVVEAMTASLLVLLGGLALALAAMGVYAVIAYGVNQRTQEFGVRMALGARVSTVLWHVTRQGLCMAGAGVAIGVALAAVLTRLLAFALHGVSPFDGLTFCAVPLILLATAALASLVPAVRAARVTPSEALRQG